MTFGCYSKGAPGGTPISVVTAAEPFHAFAAGAERHDHGAFTRVRVMTCFPDAAAAWDALQGVAPCSPYQTRAWAEAWSATIGLASDLEPCIVVAHDEADEPVALLPLTCRRAIGFRVAQFIGGKDSNSNLALFANPALWTPFEIRRLLRKSARTAKIDAFVLRNQPERWDGHANPTAALSRQPSPSAGHSCMLVGEAEAARKLSKHARKILRQKEGRLVALGQVDHRVAANAAEADAAIDAYLAMRTSRAAATGIAPPTDRQQAFYRAAARSGAPGAPALELHTLWCGAEICGVFGGVGDRGRFSGMILAIDSRPDIARCSPGDLLLRRVTSNLHSRGFTSFDLGLGEASYKDAICDVVEPMFDNFVGITPQGRALAACVAAGGRLKRVVKASPRLWRAVRTTRATLLRLSLNRR